MQNDFETHRARQIGRLNNQDIRTYPATRDLVRLFRRGEMAATKKGEPTKRSFAIVKSDASAAVRKSSNQPWNKDAMNNGPWFIPLLWPRHSIHLQLLFWMDPELIVINGEEHPDLCSICSRAIKCEHEGVGINTRFECVATPKLLVLEG
jgi:hypothetical protein